MFRRMFQGGPSRKQGPRLAIRDADEEPPRDTPVRPCEWPWEILWIKRESKKNLAHICVTPVLRILRIAKRKGNKI